MHRDLVSSLSSGRLGPGGGEAGRKHVGTAPSRWSQGRLPPPSTTHTARVPRQVLPWLSGGETGLPLAPRELDWWPGPASTRSLSSLAVPPSSHRKPPGREYGILKRAEPLLAESNHVFCENEISPIGFTIGSGFPNPGGTSPGPTGGTWRTLSTS